MCKHLYSAILIRVVFDELIAFKGQYCLWYTHLFRYDIVGLSWDNFYPNHCSF